MSFAWRGQTTIASRLTNSLLIRSNFSFPIRAVGATARWRMSTTHEERTLSDLRQTHLHDVVLDHIHQVNEDVRLIRLKTGDRSHIRQESVNLSLSHSISNLPLIQYSFLPGQWVDLHIPGFSQVGGFTITSTPFEASAGRGSRDYGFIELAVQNSPRNPPAAWLWRPVDDIIDSKLAVRVGGSFFWPPSDSAEASTKRLVLIAGGVGIK